MNLEMGILQGDLTYVSALFCFVFSCLCATSIAAYLSDVPLESLTGSSDKFNGPGWSIEDQVPVLMEYNKVYAWMVLDSSFLLRGHKDAWQHADWLSTDIR